MKTLIVIPARLHSTRLPEKLLRDQTGKPLIQHTYEAALGSKLADGVLVAADDDRLVNVVKSFGGNVCLTDISHRSGTDRLAEVAQSHPETELFVNLQGDEPEIDPRDIDQAIALLRENPQAHISTLATPIRQQEQLENSSCVKVVMDGDGRAMYFSRSPIPFCQDGVNQWLDQEPAIFYQHIGLYCYRREFLLDFARLPRPDCEAAESLEQLRALHAGKTILVGQTSHGCLGIDTPADYEAFVSRQLN